MTSVEQTFEQFQKNFEQVTLTLIASMNKIQEHLGRVVETMELTEKLRIQNSENLQNLSHLEKQVKSLINRLDKMSQGGFQLPAVQFPSVSAKMGTPTSAVPAPVSNQLDSLLNVAYTGNSAPVDDLEKEFGPLKTTNAVTTPPKDEVSSSSSPNLQISSNEEIVPNPPRIIPPACDDHTPIDVSDDLPPPPKLPSMEVPSEVLPSLTPMPKNIPEHIKSVPPPTPVPTGVPETSIGLPNLSPLPTPRGAAPTPISFSNPPVLSANTPQNIPAIVAESDGLQKVPMPNTPKDYFTNLMIDLSSTKTQGEFGDLILKTKDALAKKIPFNPSYFEILMYAGPFKAKKDLPVTPEIVKLTMDKIKGWLAKF